MRQDRIALAPVGLRAWLLLVASLTYISFCGLFAPAASAQLERAREPTRTNEEAFPRLLAPPNAEASRALREAFHVPDWAEELGLRKSFNLLDKETFRRLFSPPNAEASRPFHFPEGKPFSLRESSRLDFRGPTEPVNQSDFDKDGHLRADIYIDKAQEIVVKFPDPSRPTVKAGRIPSDRGPPLWGVEHDPGLFLKMSNTADPAKFEQFRSDPFKTDKMQFVSFVHDTATEEAIRSASPLRDHLLEPPPDTLEKIRAEFKKHKGNTFVIMGHVEGGRFVAKDPTGQFKLVDISLQDITAEAAQIGCKVLVYGCHSASANVPAGVIQDFNPIDAVTRLNKAVEAPTDYAFYKTLASKNISLLLDESVLTDRNDAPVARMVSFEIYSGLTRSALRGGPQLIASGFMITPWAVPAPTPTPTSAVPPSESEIGLGDGNQRTSNQ